VRNARRLRLVVWNRTLLRLVAFVICQATLVRAELAEEKPTPIPIAIVDRGAPVSFADEILPILKKSCLACHNAALAEGDLVLESAESIRKGSSHGVAVVEGRGAESLLLQLASHQRQPMMPPADNKVGAVAMTSEQLGLIKLWIDQGAQATPATRPRSIERQRLPKGLQPILALAISSDDELVACSRGDKLAVYDLRGPRLVAELVDPALAASRPGAAHEDLVRSLAFNRTGNVLASGGFRTVKLWRRPQTTVQGEITSGQPARSQAIAPGGKLLALGTQTGAIELHDLTGGQPVKVLTGHAGAVTGLVFAVDGTRLYSAALDKTLRAWDPVAALPLGKVSTPAEVRTLALVNGGTRLASGEVDGVIRIWPVAAVISSEPPAPIHEIRAHSRAVTALASIASAPERLLSGGEDGRMRLWNTASGELVRDFDHGGPVAAVAARADGKRLVSAGANGAGRMWNPDDGAMLAELPRDYRAVKSITRADAAVNYARACIEYRKEEHRESEEALKREAAALEASQKAKDEAEKMVAQKTEAATNAVAQRTAAAERANAAAAILQDAADKKSAGQKAVETADAAVKQAVIAAEQARLAAEKDKDNKDLAAAKESAEKSLAEVRKAKDTADEALVSAVAAFREAERKSQEAARAARDAADKAKGPERELQEAKNVLMGAINFIATAKVVHERAKAAVPTAQQAIVDAEATAACREAEKKSLVDAATPNQKPLGAAAFSADGTVLALAGDGQFIGLYDAELGTPIEVVEGQGLVEGRREAVSSLAFAEDGRLFSTGADGRTTIFRTGGKWSLERTIGGNDEPTELVDRVLALDFSPDGKWLATGGGLAARASELKLWDVASGKLVREIPEAHRDTVYGVRFSADGEYLASASADRLVRIFRVADGTLVRTLEGHTHHVLGVAWQSGGKLLATCGGDRLVKLWDFESATSVRTMRGDTYLLGDYKREVTSIAFIGDTEHLVTSSGDRTVRMHRTSSARDVRVFQGGATFMHAAVATSDGKLVLGGGRDGVLHIWNGESGYPVLKFEP